MTADATRWGSDEPVNEIGTASEPQPTPFARSAVESCYGECALRPLEGRPYSGWFARGALHLIAGSSGAERAPSCSTCCRRKRVGLVISATAGATRLPDPVCRSRRSQ